MVLMVITFWILGLIVGSFLNVLILRWDERTLLGRSECASCRKIVRWYDNIPIVSWLLLAGRCRTCGAAISLQYPLVEGSTAILFALYGVAFPFFLPYTFIALPAIALLVAIAVYDIHHTLIPDAWVYSFAALSFVSPFFSIRSESFDLAQFLVAGPVAALPLFALWLVSRGAWMGLGDVKLALGMGWLLGPFLGIIAVFFAFVLGAIVSVPLLLFSSEAWGNLVQRVPMWGKVAFASKAAYTMKSEIPFGPFLVASCFLIWFTQMFGLTLPLPFA